MTWRDLYTVAAFSRDFESFRGTLKFLAEREAEGEKREDTLKDALVAITTDVPISKL
jgi:hypothetical protein